MNKFLRKFLAIISTVAILTSNVGELSAVFEPKPLTADDDIAVYEDITDADENNEYNTNGNTDSSDSSTKLEIKYEDYAGLFDINFLAPDGKTSAAEYYSVDNGYLGFDLSEFVIPETWSFKLEQNATETNYYYANATDSTHFPVFNDKYINVYISRENDKDKDKDKFEQEYTGGYNRIQYRFKNITVGGVEVTFIGAITIDGVVYLYYSTADLETGNPTIGVTVVKGEDANNRFCLNYEQVPYTISYSVKVQEPDGTIRLATPADLDLADDAGEDAILNSVFGTNRVTSLEHGGYYSFSVDIPAKYTANVYRYTRYPEATIDPAAVPSVARILRRNDNYDYPVGTEVVYYAEKDGVNATPKTPDGPASFTLSQTFPADGVAEDRHIEVVLTKRTKTPKFVPTYWVKTVNAAGRGATGKGLDRSEKDGNIDPDNGWKWMESATDMTYDEETDSYTFTWIFQTNSGNYILNALELNGVGLTIPFIPYEVYSGNTFDHNNEYEDTYTVTKLPDGADAQLEFVRQFGSTQRVYRLTITNVHTDITVTGGNLNDYGNGAPEISIYSLTGTYAEEDDGAITLNAIQYLHKSGKWTTIELSKPLVEKDEFGFKADDKGNIRFKLVKSYEDPTYKFTKPDGTVYVTDGVTQSGKVVTKDDEGWYYITLIGVGNEGDKKNPDSDKIALLYIDSIPVKYTIRYDPSGQYSKDIFTQNDDEKDLINKPIVWDPNVMPSEWAYEGDSKAQEGMYFDANNIEGNVKYYDETENDMITVMYNVPIDSNGKMKFVGWQLVDGNGNIIEEIKVPKEPDENDENDFRIVNYLNAGEGFNLSALVPHRITNYQDEVDANGNKQRIYVIGLKAKWEAIVPEPTEPIPYDVVVRIVNKDGVPIENKEIELIAKELEAIVQKGKTEADIVVNIYHGQVLEWLQKNPTYSVYTSGDDLIYTVEMPPKKNEGDTAEGLSIATFANDTNAPSYDRTQKGSDGQTQVIIDVFENRGPLTINVEKGDKDDSCDNRFSVEIQSHDSENANIIGTFFVYPKSESNSSFDEIETENVRVQFVNGSFTVGDLLIGEEITIYIPTGDYTIIETPDTSNGNIDVYDIKVSETGPAASTAAPSDTNTKDVEVYPVGESHDKVAADVHHVFTNTHMPTELKVEKTQAKVSNGVAGAKQTTSLTVTPGDIVEYTVRLKNIGEYRAHDTFTVIDELPKGVELAEGAFADRDDVVVAKNETIGITTITWTINEKIDTNKSEELTYQVKVLATTAPITVLESTSQIDKPNGASYYFVNEVANYNGSSTAVELNVKTYSLSISTMLSNTKGTKVDENKTFEFNVTLTDILDYSIVVNGETLTFKNGVPTTISVKQGDSITISGIPNNATYKVEQKPAPSDPYSLKSITVGNTENTTASSASATINSANAAVVFNYNYTPADAEWTPHDVVKILEGRKWKAGDSFTFEIALTSNNGDYVDFTNAKRSVTISDTSTNHSDSFGTITFTKTGTYTFDVTEKEESILGVKYDSKTYKVTVEVTDGLTNGVPNGTLVATVTDEPDSYDFTNKYTAKPVTVATISGEKVISGRAWTTSDDGKYEFTIAAKNAANPLPKDTTVSASDGEFAFGEIEFTAAGTYIYEVSEVGAGEVKNGLTYDSTVYTVTVEVTDDQNGQLKAEVSYSIGVTPANVMKFTNVYTVGSLTVTNTVTGEGSDNDKEFNFTVTLGDQTFTNSEFKNGEATFKLKSGETKTFNDIPAGTAFTVTETEANQNGYTTTIVDDSGEDTADGKGTITVNGVKVDFTNDYSAKPVSWAPSVKKIISGKNSWDATDKFTFNLKLTSDNSANVDENAAQSIEIADGDNDHTKAFADVKFSAKGTYVFEISEDKTNPIANITYPDGSTTVTVVIEDNGLGSLVVKSVNDEVPANVKPFEITNIYTPPTGSLTITNEITGDEADKAKVFNFTVELSDKSFSKNGFTNGVAKFALADGESKTFENIIAGTTFTVTEAEANQDGYRTTVTNNGKGTIVANDTVTISFTNTKPAPPKPETGSLTVTNTVDGDEADKNKEFHFTVTLDDPTFNNDDFENGVAEFTLKDGEDITFNGIPEGTTFTVTEAEANQDGYGTTVTNNGKGTIVANTTVTVAFTNTKPAPPKPETGSLMVTNTVDGDEADKNKEFHFTVTLDDPTFNNDDFENGVAEFTLKDGEDITFSGIPEGTTFTVTEAEANQDGYGTTVTNNGKGTIVANDTVTISFTNTKPAPPKPETGSLTVTNIVDGDEADKNKEFHFTVELSDKTFNNDDFENGVAEFTLKDGEDITFSGIPEGTAFTVTEAEANQDGYGTIVTNNGKGTIVANTTVTVAFTNTKPAPPKPETGSLTVTNTVDGDEADKNKEFHFTVELSDKTFNNDDFENGVAEFTLKDGEDITFSGIPEGTTFTVTEAEANQDGYGTTVTNNGKGTIVANTTVTVAFTNTKPAPPPPIQSYGSLTIIRSDEEAAAESEISALAMLSDEAREGEYHFTVVLSDTSFNNDDFVNGAASFTLADGESRTFEGVPEGLTFTVTEEEANQNGYTTVYDPSETGVITADYETVVKVINRKNAGSTEPSDPNDPNDPNEPNDPNDPNGPSIPDIPPVQYNGILKVIKTVSGAGADYNEYFNFTVRLAAPISGQFGNMYFVNGVARISLKHGESATAFGLPVGVYYEVTEDYAEGYTSTASDSTGVILPGIVRAASFLNIKDASQNTPTDPTDTENPSDGENKVPGSSDVLDGSYEGTSNDEDSELNGNDEGSITETELPDDFAPSQNDDPEDVNPTTGTRTNGMLVSMAMLAAIAAVTLKRRSK